MRNGRREGLTLYGLKILSTMQNRKGRMVISILVGIGIGITCVIGSVG